MFSFAVPEKSKSWTELAHRGPANAGPWRAKRKDPFGFSKILLQNIKKIKEGHFAKKSINAEKTEMKVPLGFFNINSVTKHIKIERVFWRKKHFVKTSQCRKQTERWDLLVSSGVLCYVEKRNNFYISVLRAKWSNLTH